MNIMSVLWADGTGIELNLPEEALSFGRYETEISFSEGE
jgi:hypothetical protein